ncbi:hypothetical protein Patl1_07623 [Pistacia atlantica]|uniref:Uncharacterized protein n=1 Tax=Pistacia atlantica TaxID=434234 RepID=A0ACC1AHM2_9ROSI|nr:hypothetical protein Patl1_07623 [Pistacia atlantica]
MHNTGVDQVPIGIGKLKHLRYLDLSKNIGIMRLPSSITRLQNLQTLKLMSCKMLEKLPRDMRKMTSLRHLELDQCIGLTQMPCGLGQLTALNTLSRFVVGKASSSSSSSGSLRELKYLNNLRGELAITKLENLKNAASESREANLKSKQHLQVLRLEWTREVNDHKIIEEDEKLLEILQPHPQLKEFHIYGYRAGRFPDWIISDLSLLLPNLLEINIWRCYRCLELPLFSQLSKLKVLKLEEGLQSLTFLEYLSVSNCPKLLCLPGEALRRLTSLRFLSISGCAKLMSLSKGLKHLAALEELEIKECRELDLSNGDEDGMQLQGLKCLCTLKIGDMPKLVSLPDGLQQATSLKNLWIRSCPGLKSLPDWIGNLTLLRRLEISDCLGLTSLPQSMCYLKALQSLEISKCPLSFAANQKGTSANWPQLAHIPDIQIDTEKYEKRNRKNCFEEADN